MQISRIRLSDKTSHHCTRPAVFVLSQTDEPKEPIKVREGKDPTLAPPNLVLIAQPPTQQRRRVAVERFISTADAPYTEVVCTAHA